MAFPRALHFAEALPQPRIIETSGVEVVEVAEIVEVAEVVEQPCSTPPANLNGATEHAKPIPFASTLRHIA
jgi:hypothetical protein